MVAKAALVALALAIDPASVSAQASPPSPTAPAPPKRTGLLRLGPLLLNPRLHLGTVGLDTNVFYTATDRRTDITGSGGPGLEMILPLGPAAALIGDGSLDYLYYLRTPSLRRFSGAGKGRLEWAGRRIFAYAEHGYARTFNRPSFEVDRRIEQEEQRTVADVRLNVGHRLVLDLQGSRARNDVEDGATFQGADLTRTLTRRTDRGFLELGYRVTPKTSLIVEADYQADRFRLDPTRDSDSDRLGGGFRLASETRLSGRAAGGVRSFRPRARSGHDLLKPYVQADLVYHFGPRTRLGASYSRDIQYSAFSTTGDTPTVRVESTRLRLEKGLGGHFDLRLHLGLTHSVTDGAITLDPVPGPPTTAVRDDKVREAGADLGYTFRARLRIGAAATYVRRRSTFADLGIEGLLLGGTVTFTP